MHESTERAEARDAAEARHTSEADDGRGSGPRPAPVRAEDAAPRDHEEAFQVLTHAAARGKGAIPGELLARHVLRLYGDADWPVQRGAMEALQRRRAFARRDGLRVAERPGGGEPLGAYTTRRAKEPERPYRTVLERVDPLAASCDCADFVGGGLAVCKHVLVVLEMLAAKPRVWRRALEADGLPAPRPRLTWDPVRPLVGRGDPLQRVRLTGGGSPGALEPWLADGRAGDDARAVRSVFADDPAQRLALVKALRSYLRRRRSNRALEPALEAMLDAELARLELVAEARGALGARMRRLGTMHRDLYPYQREGVGRFLAEGRLLLADDMGLGKTAQAIGAGHALFRDGAVRRGLLVVPASLKHQWAREWERFSDVPIEVVEGNPSMRAEAYADRTARFLVVNYEQVLRDLSPIRRWKPDMVVLDEAQRIKNWATKTAAYIKALRPRYRLVLTGTPFENRLEELASVMDWVDPHALQPKWRLVPWHSVYEDGDREVVGARNLDTLRERLAHCMVRRRRPEILDQLPPRTDTTVPVEMTEAQREAHADLVDPIRRLVASARRRPLTQPEFLRLMMLLNTQRIIANGIAQLEFQDVWPGLENVRRPDEALLRSLSTPKLLELRDLIGQLAVDQGRKVVVFSQWRRMLRLAEWAVRDVLASAGARGVFFTGRESARRRQHNVVDLHDDPRTRVLFATDAGGVGLNLQRACTCCINLDLPWNPAVLEQRIGRIHRLGQGEPIDVFHLVSEGSIEQRIAGLVSDKKALFSGLFDGDSDEIRFDDSGSFLEGIEHIVEPATAPEDDETAAAEGAPDADDEPDADADPAAEHQIDAMLDAADESSDMPAEAEREREPGDGGAIGAPAAAELLSSVRVERRDDGGMRIDAPPEAADTLATLFEQMGRMLRAQARE